MTLRARRTLTACACTIVATVFLECSGRDLPTQATGAAPSPAPGLTIVSGASVSDSIQSTFGQPLVVQLRDTHGNASPGVSVHFTVAPRADTARASERVLLVGSGSGAAFGDSATTITDSLGHASVLLEGGTVAGQSTVRVDAGGLGASATFTVTPGQTVKITVPGPAPLCLVGGTAKYGIDAVDRLGNDNPNVTFAIDSAVATIDADGTVHGRAPAVALVTITSAPITVFQQIAVVPSTPILTTVTTLAGQANLVTMRLDGTQMQTLVGSESVLAGSADNIDATITSDGTLFYPSLGADQGRLHVRSSNGSDRRLTSDSLGSIGEYSPRVSPDGQWVYFLASSATSFVTIWRIHPDGTGGEQIGPQTMQSATQPVFLTMSIDPNGTGLYILQTSLQAGPVSALRFDLATRKFALGGIFSLSVVAYSPADDRFVYAPVAGGIVIRTVATGAESGFPVREPISFSSSPWTPDGRLVLFDAEGAIGVMDGSTGRAVVLPSTSQSLYGPAKWAP